MYIVIHKDDFTGNFVVAAICIYFTEKRSSENSVPRLYSGVSNFKSAMYCMSYFDSP